jgi:LysR family hydrogen peroxide-inducible transcriptional activator
MPTLRQLRYFETLARVGHFGRAAAECAVTQPALSMQIQELEREIGVPLVERRRDGLALTPEGAQILVRCRAILSEVDEIRHFASQSGTLSGSLRLGIIPTAGPYLLPDLLPALGQSHPAVKLQVRETRTARLLDELQHGNLDVIIAALPLDSAEIASQPLFDDRFLLATPADRPPPPMPDLMDYIASEQMLLLEEGHCLRDQALRHCESAGIRYGEIYGTSNISTLVQMVANGLGITIVPELSIDAETARGKVTLSRFAEPQPCRTLALAWRRRSPAAAHYPAIADIIRTVAMERLARSAAALTQA